MTDSEEMASWCDSGLLALCGKSMIPAPPPFGLVTSLVHLEQRIGAAARAVGVRLEVDWTELVLGRAGLRHFAPHGRTSANGSCRMLASTDGYVAVNLPRSDDLSVLEARIEGPVGDDHWSSLELWAGERTKAAVMERTALLHLAAGALEAPSGEAVIRSQLAGRSTVRPLQDLVVVDLTSMWAGPLCALVLHQAGARVVKVEARARRDGARMDERFYSWLHPDGQAEELVDLGTPSGREHLRLLLETADVVLESSRPRALRQLGLDPSHLNLREGIVWAAITARGPADPMAVGFGDDAAVAGGLVAWDTAAEPVFCGDAIADPIAGMVAAAEVLEALGSGGGRHLGISMAACAGSMIATERFGERAVLNIEVTPSGVWCEIDGVLHEVCQPRAPEGY